MAVDLSNYESIITELKSLYNELLTVTKENVFYKETKEEAKNAIENLAISDEKKAENLIQFYAQITNNTITKTFDQAILIIDKGSKLSKEIELLTAQIEEAKAGKDLKVQQKTNAIDENTRANAINAKDILLKQAQTDLANADKQIKNYQYSDILPQELANLIKDGTTKANQALLITRQKTAYDDNLKIEKAKALKDLGFGYALGGNVIPVAIQTDMLQSIKNISI